MPKNEERMAELEGQIVALTQERDTALENHAHAIKKLNEAERSLESFKKEKRESLESEVHSIETLKGYDCSNKSDETLQALISYAHAITELEKKKEQEAIVEDKNENKDEGEMEAHTKVPKGSEKKEEKSNDPLKKFWEA